VRSIHELHPLPRLNRRLPLRQHDAGSGHPVPDEVRPLLGQPAVRGVLPDQGDCLGVIASGARGCSRFGNQPPRATHRSPDVGPEAGTEAEANSILGSPGMAHLDVKPVTIDTWPDFVRLFEARGSPHYCWCTAYRLPHDPQRDSEAKKAAMCALVEAGTPVGVLACEAGAAVGWCSVAPRETYLRLGRSRTMPRRTTEQTPTWTVLCFFVARAHRGQEVARVLLEGAVAYAQEQGAALVEGYPFDSAGISSTHRGHSRLFEAAGFVRDGTRWFLLLPRPGGAGEGRGEGGGQER
jgi:GNAT superfamily N-acetyltransferase